ncbi:10304_t:CDS:2 [Racocetra persica]|uniref:10304_t:CDS:1 n=1 Tax=Racocetra persica TaxID=160502 RepID=A0ACA9KD29_9GLOM|nr:10304_t:CDS:2 [Racocetra persica]
MFEHSTENVTSPICISDNELASNIESTSDNSNKNNAESSSDNPNKNTTEDSDLNIESFLTTNFDHLFFNNSNEVSYNLSQELPTYSFQDIESIYKYLESWFSLFNNLELAKHLIEESRLYMLYNLHMPFVALAVTYTMKYKEDNKVFPDHLTLCSLISNKVQKLFGIVKKHKRRYWLGTWRLIELLHVTQCPAKILIKSGLTANFLMSSTYVDYNNFFKNLLNNENIFYKKPIFEVSVIQKIIDLGIII